MVRCRLSRPWGSVWWVSFRKTKEPPVKDAVKTVHVSAGSDCDRRPTTSARSQETAKIRRRQLGDKRAHRHRQWKGAHLSPSSRSGALRAPTGPSLYKALPYYLRAQLARAFPSGTGTLARDGLGGSRGGPVNCLSTPSGGTTTTKREIRPSRTKSANRRGATVVPWAVEPTVVAQGGQ